MPLRFKVENSQEFTTLKISGNLDDDLAGFKEESLEAVRGKQRVHVDLGGLGHMNSVGLMNWVAYGAALGKDRKVFLERVGRIFLDAFQMYPKARCGWPVLSLFAEFDCEECNVTTTHLINVADLQPGAPFPRKPCQKCGALADAANADDLEDLLTDMKA